MAKYSLQYAIFHLVVSQGLGLADGCTWSTLLSKVCAHQHLLPRAPGIPSLRDLPTHPRLKLPSISVTYSCVWHTITFFTSPRDAGSSLGSTGWISPAHCRNFPHSLALDPPQWSLHSVHHPPWIPGVCPGWFIAVLRSSDTLVISMLPSFSSPQPNPLLRTSGSSLLNTRINRLLGKLALSNFCLFSWTPSGSRPLAQSRLLSTAGPCWVLLLNVSLIISTKHCCQVEIHWVLILLTLVLV